MKKLQFILLLSVIAIFSWQCTTFKSTKITSQQTVKSNVGILYCLPQTNLNVNVEVAKETRIKGPFADYAEKLLGLKNVIGLTQTNYKVIKIEVDPQIVPDTAHQYLINKHAALFGNRSWKLGFDRFGGLSSINNRNHGRLDSVESLHSFMLNSEILNYPNFFKLYADASQIEKIDTVYEMVKMDTIVMSKPIIKRTLVTKTLLQRAEEAADYILKFRLKRYELISATQEIPYSKEALEFMNNQLIKMENDYLDLFTGITQTEILKFQIPITPSKSSKNSPIPLFGFTDDLGFVAYANPQAKHYNLLLTADHQIKYDTLPCKVRTQIPYRTPLQTNVSIWMDETQISQSLMIPILQFGEIRYLPRRTKSISIDAKTGILNSVFVK